MTTATLQQPDVLRYSKPKRSLNVWHMFYKIERERLLAVLPSKKRSKQSRGHGKIPFVELTKTVAAKWKHATKEQKDECLRLVAVDRKRFEKEMAEYKATKAWVDSVKASEAASTQQETARTPSPAAYNTLSNPFMSSEISVVSNDSSSNQQYSGSYLMNEMPYQQEFSDMPAFHDIPSTDGCASAMETPSGSFGEPFSMAMQQLQQQPTTMQHFPLPVTETSSTSSNWEPMMNTFQVAEDTSLEPNTNIDWSTPSTMAELADRLDKDCQDMLIRALL